MQRVVELQPTMVNDPAERAERERRDGGDDCLVRNTGM
jgi:hypothetical protein